MDISFTIAWSPPDLLQKDYGASCNLWKSISKLNTKVHKKGRNVGSFTHNLFWRNKKEWGHGRKSEFITIWLCSSALPSSSIRSVIFSPKFIPLSLDSFYSKLEKNLIEKSTHSVSSNWVTCLLFRIWAHIFWELVINAINYFF